MWARRPFWLILFCLHFCPCAMPPGLDIFGRRQTVVPKMSHVFALLLITGFFLAIAIISERAIPRYLEISHPLRKADIIIVLGGDYYGTRPARAAEIYANEYAPRILMTGFSKPSESAEEFRSRYKIPTDALLVEPAATSTSENASFSAPLLRQNGVHTAILVTSWYHSRRALDTFRRVMPDISFVSAPTSRNQDRSANGQSVRTEFLKSLCSSFLGTSRQ